MTARNNATTMLATHVIVFFEVKVWDVFILVDTDCSCWVYISALLYIMHAFEYSSYLLFISFLRNSSWDCSACSSVP